MQRGPPDFLDASEERTLPGDGVATWSGGEGDIKEKGTRDLMDRQAADKNVNNNSGEPNLKKKWAGEKETGGGEEGDGRLNDRAARGQRKVKTSSSSSPSSSLSTARQEEEEQQRPTESQQPVSFASFMRMKSGEEAQRERDVSTAGRKTGSPPVFSDSDGFACSLMAVQSGDTRPTPMAKSNNKGDGEGSLDREDGANSLARVSMSDADCLTASAPSFPQRSLFGFQLAHEQGSGKAKERECVKVKRGGGRAEEGKASSASLSPSDTHIHLIMSEEVPAPPSSSSSSSSAGQSASVLRSSRTDAERATAASQKQAFAFVSAPGDPLFVLKGGEKSGEQRREKGTVPVYPFVPASLWGLSAPLSLSVASSPWWKGKGTGGMGQTGVGGSTGRSGQSLVETQTGTPDNRVGERSDSSPPAPPPLASKQTPCARPREDETETEQGDKEEQRHGDGLLPLLDSLPGMGVAAVANFSFPSPSLTADSDEPPLPPPDLDVTFQLLEGGGAGQEQREDEGDEGGGQTNTNPLDAVIPCPAQPQTASTTPVPAPPILMQGPSRIPTAVSTPNGNNGGQKEPQKVPSPLIPLPQGLISLVSKPPPQGKSAKPDCLKRPDQHRQQQQRKQQKANLSLPIPPNPLATSPKTSETSSVPLSVPTTIHSNPNALPGLGFGWFPPLPPFCCQGPFCSPLAPHFPSLPFFPGLPPPPNADAGVGGICGGGLGLQGHGGGTGGRSVGPNQSKSHKQPAVARDIPLPAPLPFAIPFHSGLFGAVRQQGQAPREQQQVRRGSGGENMRKGQARRDEEGGGEEARVGGGKRALDEGEERTRKKKKTEVVEEEEEDQEEEVSRKTNEERQTKKGKGKKLQVRETPKKGEGETPKKGKRLNQDGGVARASPHSLTQKNKKEQGRLVGPSVPVSVPNNLSTAQLLNAHPIFSHSLFPFLCPPFLPSSIGGTRCPPDKKKGKAPPGERDNRRNEREWLDVGRQLPPAYRPPDSFAFPLTSQPSSSRWATSHAPAAAAAPPLTQKKRRQKEKQRNGEEESRIGSRGIPTTQGGPGGDDFLLAEEESPREKGPHTQREAPTEGEQREVQIPMHRDVQEEGGGNYQPSFSGLCPSPSALSRAVSRRPFLPLETGPPSPSSSSLCKFGIPSPSPRGAGEGDPSPSLTGNLGISSRLWPPPAGPSPPNNMPGPSPPPMPGSFLGFQPSPPADFLPNGSSFPFPPPTMQRSVGLPSEAGDGVGERQQSVPPGPLSSPLDWAPSRDRPALSEFCLGPFGPQSRQGPWEMEREAVGDQTGLSRSAVSVGCVSEKDGRSQVQQQQQQKDVGGPQPQVPRFPPPAAEDTKAKKKRRRKQKSLLSSSSSSSSDSSSDSSSSSDDEQEDVQGGNFRPPPGHNSMTAPGAPRFFSSTDDFQTDDLEETQEASQEGRMVPRLIPFSRALPSLWGLGSTCMQKQKKSACSFSGLQQKAGKGGPKGRGEQFLFPPWAPWPHSSSSSSSCAAARPLVSLGGRKGMPPPPPPPTCAAWECPPRALGAATAATAPGVRPQQQKKTSHKKNQGQQQIRNKQGKEKTEASSKTQRNRPTKAEEGKKRPLSQQPKSKKKKQKLEQKEKNRQKRPAEEIVAGSDDCGTISISSGSSDAEREDLCEKAKVRGLRLSKKRAEGGSDLSGDSSGDDGGGGDEEEESRDGEESVEEVDNDELIARTAEIRKPLLKLLDVRTVPGLWRFPDDPAADEVAVGGRDSNGNPIAVQELNRVAEKRWLSPQIARGGKAAAVIGDGIFLSTAFVDGEGITEYVGHEVDTATALRLRSEGRGATLVSLHQEAHDKRKGGLCLIAEPLKSQLSEGLSEGLPGLGGGQYARLLPSEERLQVLKRTVADLKGKATPKANARMTRHFDSKIWKERIFLEATRRIQRGEEIYIRPEHFLSVTPAEWDAWQEEEERKTKRCGEKTGRRERAWKRRAQKASGDGVGGAA
uniref:Uncharacterized protein n=1 Tax=Chromera velia CCMP2878 TaxID=1169474 RepID=A0A0G4GSB7_9ALVE|eukprot:Cvel_23171.t1-p1 / transcript=Cvel_23171.t1 / gene=Cvel_23171 / organism=Chromera_velia_CCMP2878 / gene_product=hypothetical protein / transcript_product=hypothetical protein / location=Cvel_scaffold2359:8755-17134(-) / protein_length=1965 / sequence_SO=supercontig / SO=protein_coding / is_pseudo=false